MVSPNRPRNEIPPPQKRYSSRPCIKKCHVANKYDRCYWRFRNFFNGDPHSEKKLCRGNRKLRNWRLDPVVSELKSFFQPAGKRNFRNNSNIYFIFLKQRACCWSSPEVLEREENISLKADIWSYGVCVWELFSLGGEPYQDQNLPSAGELLTFLQNGNILKQPELCNNMEQVSF